MDMKAMDIYDVMEETLKDDIRSITVIKKLGRELIEKMKMIDSEINIINPDHTKWNELTEDSKNKLGLLYGLKNQYRIQFDMISIVLNQRNKIVLNGTQNKFKDFGLDNKFFIDDLEE
jgi:hypothetical protein